MNIGTNAIEQIKGLEPFIVTGAWPDHITVKATHRRSPLGKIAMSRSVERRRMPMHVHELAHVSVVLEGAYEELLPSGAARLVEYGDLVFYPAGFAHEVTFAGTITRVASVNLNERMLIDLGLATATSSLRGKANASELATMEDLLGRGGQFSGTTLARLAQSFDRLIFGFVDSSKSPAWLVEVRALLDVHLVEPPSLAQLARAVGKHPNYVSDAFRRFYGVPIGRYVRRQRLLKASAELLSSDCTATEAAHRAGFADAAHFARCFKAASDSSALAVRDCGSIQRELRLPIA